MKDKKILFLSIFAGITGFILFFASKPAVKNDARHHADIADEANIARLESQVQQLRGLITAFVELNRSLNSSFQKEKEQRALEERQRGSLEQTLREANSQNESLIKELSRVKINLELTLPIKQGIERIESALAGADVSAGKEKELKQKLQDINRQLQLIDAQIPALLKENVSYKRLSENLNGILEKQQKDMDALRNALDEEKNRRQSVKKADEDLKTERRKNTDFERIKNNLTQANASLHAEINRITKELKETRIKISRASREKDTAAGRKDEMIARLQKDYDRLKVDFTRAEEALKNNEAELGRRADKILVGEEKLSGTEAQLSQIQSRYNELLKDSASLREQSVAAQIETEELKIRLNQSALKASGLENRLSQIGTILKTPKPGASSAAGQENKMVEVELYPDKTEEEILDEIPAETKSN